MDKMIKDEDFKTIMEHALEAIALMNQEGVIVFVNQAFETISGYSNHELIGQNVEILVPKAFRQKHVKLREQYVLHPIVRPLNMGLNLYLQHKDRHVVPVDISLNPLKKDTNLLIVIVTVREAKFQSDTMQKVLDFIQHDALTKLFTLDSFMEKLNYTLSLFKNVDGIIAVFYIDIDKFKSINDTYGHSVGNQILEIFSTRLVRGLRDSDVVARYGGDEFCCFTTHAHHDLNVIKLITKKLLHSISQPIVVDQYEITITASIGISLFPEDGSNATTLLQKADKAMYAAKKKGNTYVIFESE
jgi:two-component system CheB/CheR fusion protein